MEKGILTKITQGLETFKPSEKKVAHFIIDNLKEAVGLSIMELAEKSGTSEATIVRFCRTLGLKGYQDFKLAISLDISSVNNKKKIIHEKISEDDTAEEIFEKISIGSIKAIEDTKSVKR